MLNFFKNKNAINIKIKNKSKEDKNNNFNHEKIYEIEEINKYMYILKDYYKEINELY